MGCGGSKNKDATNSAVRAADSAQMSHQGTNETQLSGASQSADLGSQSRQLTAQLTGQSNVSQFSGQASSQLSGQPSGSGQLSGQLSEQLSAQMSGDPIAVTPPASTTPTPATPTPATPTPATPKPTAQANSPSSLMHSDTFLDEKPDGLYLVFTTANQGTFFGKFSKEKVPGALAFVRPHYSANIPDHKYKRPKELHTKTQAGRKLYNQGWVLFIKEGKLLDGDLVILDSLDGKESEDSKSFPKMRIYFRAGTQLTEIQRGAKNTPYKLKFADGVAVMPESFGGFDPYLKAGSEITKAEFTRVALAAPERFTYEF